MSSDFYSRKNADETTEELIKMAICDQSPSVDLFALSFASQATYKQPYCIY